MIADAGSDRLIDGNPRAKVAPLRPPGTHRRKKRSHRASVRAAPPASFVRGQSGENAEVVLQAR